MKYPLTLALACALALPVLSAPTQPSPLRVSWATAPQATKVQKAVFAHLSKQIGREISMPEVPANGLVSWSLRGYETAGSDPKQLYPVVYEQLLVAQKLAEEKNPQQKRRALRLAHNANFKVATRLRDTALCALIFDAFILPNIEAAPTGKGTLSRARLLQDAASAYRLAGETPKQADSLRLLVQVSQADGDTDGADWARVKLSDVLISQKLYAQAIEQLKAVSAVNMAGAKRRIPQLEALQKAAPDANRAPQKTTQTQTAP
mgnify:CR=1 FL=1